MLINKDGNKTNNCAYNLEWVKQKENVHHAWKNVLCKAKCGTENVTAKFTEEEIRYIRENYKPYAEILMKKHWQKNLMCIQKLSEKSSGDILTKMLSEFL